MTSSVPNLTGRYSGSTINQAVLVLGIGRNAVVADAQVADAELVQDAGLKAEVVALVIHACPVVASWVSLPAADVELRKLDGAVGALTNPIPTDVMMTQEQLATVMLGLSGVVPLPVVDVGVTSSGVVVSILSKI